MCPLFFISIYRRCTVKRELTPAEVSTLQHQLALAKRRELRHKQTIADLRKAKKEADLRAFTDRLTGLMTAEPIENRLEREMAIAPGSEKRKPRIGAENFLICALDLRGFRGINNRIGHLAGNQTLKNVATALIKAVRSNDLVGRVGGDEFLLVLWNVDMIHIQVTLNRILGAIRGAAEGLDARLGCVYWERVMGPASATDLINTADQLERKLRRQRKTGYLVSTKIGLRKK